MGLEAEVIQNLIEKNIPDAEVEITDLRGDGDHYAVHIISNAFIGKSKVQQHQMVYKALEGKMGNELHALAVKTSTKE